jgi:predicted DCC family thiol-disulfide oxidoreductase YuxK
VLVYDGDCGFCTRSVAWLLRRGRAGFEAKAWQSLPDLEEVGLTESGVRDAAFWLQEGRPPVSGAAAIAAALIARGRPTAFTGYILRLPLIDVVAAAVYRVVAANRHRMPSGTSACRVPDDPERQ